MLNGEKQLNENRIQIHKKVYQDGTCLIRCRNYRGDTRMEIHGVFPGIQLIYIAAHTDWCPFGATGREKRIEIHHCREGRIERRHADRYLYLAPGDMALLHPQSDSGDLSFPLCHYHGIAITIDTAVAPKCFSCFLEDVDVQPKQLADRLCGQSGCFVARRKKYVEHIFSELYTVPKSYRKGYFKVKIMELLLVLGGLELEDRHTEDRVLSCAQTALAKQAAAYLMEHMESKVTVMQLAQELHVSETTLRNAFKGVYGVPIHTYVRIQKMNQAAVQLIHTDLTIQEIANKCGYDNASKFSSAFREIMGEAPLEYRRNHR